MKNLVGINRWAFFVQLAVILIVIGGGFIDSSFWLFGGFFGGILSALILIYLIFVWSINGRPKILLKSLFTSFVWVLISVVFFWYVFGNSTLSMV